MRILHGLESLPDPSLAGAAATWGVFDGVHAGHRSVLRTLTLWAGERRSPSAVITFDRHPAEVLRGVEMPLVCPLEERIGLIGECGVDATIVLPFTRAFSENTAEAFVGDLVVGRAGARAILLGHDSHFGRDRAGDLETLRSLAGRLGIEVRSCEPVRFRGRPVSSSLVREAVSAGRLEEAAELLGRPFALHGVVVAGEGRGSAIGVPTANVEPRHRLSPPRGVYAVTVPLEGREHPGVANLGTRPTFHESGAETFEVHLIGWSGGPLCGRRLGVRFHRKIRDERRFGSAEELVAQIRADVEAAWGILQK